MPIKGEMYPKELYLTFDKDGAHWWDGDPVKDSNTVDFEMEMKNFYGDANMVNPIVLKLYGKQLQRHQEFTLADSNAINMGELQGTVIDGEGYDVKILDVMDKGSDFYPIIGIVLNEEGAYIETRTFANDGACSDNLPEHSLYIKLLE